MNLATQVTVVAIRVSAGMTRRRYAGNGLKNYGAGKKLPGEVHCELRVHAQVLARCHASAAAGLTRQGGRTVAGNNR
jgi:hypothetical protein